MLWFQQALSICIISSVLVRGYVLIAADVADFKNLANTFLSRNLADQLSSLVSESSHDNIRTRPTDEKIPEVSFSQVGNMVKDKLLKAYAADSISIEKTTRSPTDYNRDKITRYRTVKNDDEKRREPIKNNKMTQPDYENENLEPRYVRDDLESLLQNGDHSYNNYKKNSHEESNKNEKTNLFSQETEPVGLFDKIIHQNRKDHYGMSKGLDYTETKLGDWNYNADTSQKPVPIKNVKSGYKYQLDKYSDRKIPEMPNEKWKHEVQPLEEDAIFTTHSWNKFNKIKTAKQRIVGLNNDENRDLQPQKEDQKKRQKYKHKEMSFEKFDSYESLPSGSKNKVSSAKKAEKQHVVEYDTFDQDFQESKHDNIRKEKTRPLLKEYSGMFETQKFEFENQFHDKIKEDNPQVGEHILEPKPKETLKKLNKQSENYMHNAHKSEFKNKPSNIEEGRYKTEKESYDLEPKNKKKPLKQLMEENDLYEKYALNDKTDDSHETKIYHQQTGSNYKNLGIKNEFKGKNLNKKESYNLEPKDKDIPKRKPNKQLMEENDMFKKYALSYKSDDSSETKVNYQQTHDSDLNRRITNKYRDKNQNKKERYNMEPKEKDIYKRQPYKPFSEEHDMHDKYPPSHKPDVSGESETYNQHTDSDLDKNPEIRNKFHHKFTAPKEHDHYKSNSNERLFLNDKKRPNENARYKDNSKDHQFVTESLKKQPLNEKLDDSDSDVKEIKRRPIKANTEYFTDSDEITSKPEVIKAKTENILDTVGNKNSGKKFTMKGTEIPKRQFYTMSSPDYYHKLPRIVEKYDFGEPIPENDRVRNKEKHVKREPAMINRKIRLS